MDTSPHSGAAPSKRRHFHSSKTMHITALEDSETPHHDHALLLEELGMAMPSSSPRNTGCKKPIVPFSGDMDVDEAVKKRASINKRHSFHHSSTDPCDKKQSVARKDSFHHSSTENSTPREKRRSYSAQIAASPPGMGGKRGSIQKSTMHGGPESPPASPGGGLRARKSVTVADPECTEVEEPPSPRQTSDPCPSEFFSGDSAAKDAPALELEKGRTASKGGKNQYAEDAPGRQRARGEFASSFQKKASKVLKAVKFMKAFNFTAHHGLDDAVNSHTREVKENTMSKRLMIVQEMAKVPLFSWCSQRFLNELAVTVEERTIPESREWGRGIEDHHMLLVVQGELKVSVANQEVLRISNSQCFGEAVLLGLENDWKATLRAEVATIVLRIYTDDFVKALRFFKTERDFFENLRKRSNDCMSEGTLEQRCVVFRGITENTMSGLDAHVLTRVFFPGEKLFEDGRPGEELYMLVRGVAGVEIDGRIVRQERRDNPSEEGQNDGTEADGPACFGEFALLGINRLHTVTMVAQTVCHVRVLNRAVFSEIMEKTGETIQVDEMREILATREKESQKPPTAILMEVGIFKEMGCSEDFLSFLAKHMEDRLFLPGQSIIDETEPTNRCMYLLGQGVAKVSKQKKEVAMLTSGAVFGEIIVLGLAQQLGVSVDALETCYMQILHQSVVVRGLELYPCARQSVLSLACTTSETLAPHDSLDKKEPADTDHSAQSFLTTLTQSTLFSNIDPGFVFELKKVSLDRIYMPGDCIIEEGKRGDSMFIMCSGQANVYVADPDAMSREAIIPKSSLDSVLDKSRSASKQWGLSQIGTLTIGSIAGELAMLGVSLIRSATITAVTICSMWEITQDKALAILEKFPDAQDHFAHIIVEHLERTVPTRILYLPLFRNFDRKFRMLLGLYCERRSFFPGQRIAREGQASDRLIIVNQGRATLEKKGVTVKTYGAGSYFGATVMLGIHRLYLGTLVALHTSHILLISRTSYQQAMEQYPSLIASQDLKKDEKAACEELRETVQRISARKLIWKRYQCQLLDSALPGATKITEAELLERAFGSWRERVQQMVKNRRQKQQERDQYNKMMELWVQKRHEADKLRDRKRAEQVKESVRPSTVGGNPAHRKELVKVLEDWPSPKPSPHYRLRVFGVLHEATIRPVTGAPLLPLLSARQIRGGGGKMVGSEQRVSFAEAPPSDCSAKTAAVFAKGGADQWWIQSNSPFDRKPEAWECDKSDEEFGSSLPSDLGASDPYEAYDLLDAELDGPTEPSGLRPQILPKLEPARSPQ